MLYRMSGETALVGGFRLESLLTNFSDPNPDYIYTAAWMQAQTTVTIYEPYVGIRLQQCPRPGGLSLQAVGFPFLFATIQHLNVCDNNGVPYAHTGSQYAHEGFFVEASAEYRLGLFQGMEAAGFVDWNVYQGHCPMTIERHQGRRKPRRHDRDCCLVSPHKLEPDHHRTENPHRTQTSRWSLSSRWSFLRKKNDCE